jgi:hypothetical protein
VGVFISFTLSQTGMVRHWNRHIAEETEQRLIRSMQRKRAINFFAGITTGTVLLIVLYTKFLQGAWIAILAGVVFFFLMKGIKGHYDAVARELVPTGEETMLPSRNHAVVLVSKIHTPTLRALAYARATRPSTLEALTVGVDEEDARRQQDEWDEVGIPVPLKVLQSPYREVTRPVIEYIRSLSKASPRDVVTVYIPEYVVGRWWEHLLHNQSALRLKTRLLFQPGVMVTSVPWQLASSALRADEQDL